MKVARTIYFLIYLIVRTIYFIKEEGERALITLSLKRVLTDASTVRQLMESARLIRVNGSAGTACVTLDLGACTCTGFS